ncbi:hypothetical protein ACINK0_15580 [Deinococcus sp. VB343]|uniref:hypothetical protein n=1 Tax=Deinococcus sp. VB343 TaxID=3385567 RepID=UPI0039C9825F
MTQPKARARIFTNDLALAYEAADLLTRQTGELHHIVLGDINPLTDEHTLAVTNTRATVLAMQAGYSLDTFGLPAWAAEAVRLAQSFHDAEREGTPHGVSTVQTWTAQDFTREYHMTEFLPIEHAQEFGQLTSALTRLEQAQ